ncbi:MAG: DUF1566 domain-containing protein [Candidatus Nitrohelix vancouverensis]|uniref:DUF1566 domain-containing protein n=1 Tax=Candidatus Nitrohelix vancouverensis TaxID=2705534 RepID=A0A7T0G3Z3_9BACT|nr:MAG: DUF1566 domain-containing protein [Candidatus Nitrohelix vancouverensis]
MTTSERFIENPNGIIADSREKKQWLPKDSKQDLGDWKTYDEIAGYIQIMRQVYAGGHADWRMPTLDEAKKFYDASLTHKDFEGKDIHIDPKFVVGCAYWMWTSDLNDEGKAARLNLRNGEVDYKDKSEKNLNSTRLVRNA